MQGTRGRDRARVAALTAGLRREGLDGVICALPKHVLMVAGTWPVVGLSVAIITREGWVGLIVPEDERELAENSWADAILTFSPSSLSHPITLTGELRRPLSELLRLATLGGTRLGIEQGHESEPSPYAAGYRYGNALRRLLHETLSGIETVPATSFLDRCAVVKTPYEIERIEQAAEVAVAAFASAREAVSAGAREVDVANALHAPLAALPLGKADVGRAEGFAYCMAGPNAAHAFAAFQRTRARAMQAGELALLHVNSTVDGYWTDVTRTYPIGHPKDVAARVLDAIREARARALAAIRPGVPAKAVDAAARRVLQDAGFGEAFRHPLGHGVGFSAFDHAARPVLSPISDDVLEPGTVFNVEPGVYIEGQLGARHCDMVTVTDEGYRLLTP